VSSLRGSIVFRTHEKKNNKHILDTTGRIRIIRRIISWVPMPRALFIYLKTPPGHSSIMLQREWNWNCGKGKGN